MPIISFELPYLGVQVLYEFLDILISQVIAQVEASLKALILKDGLVVVSSHLSRFEVQVLIEIFELLSLEFTHLDGVIQLVNGVLLEVLDQSPNIMLFVPLHHLVQDSPLEEELLALVRLMQLFEFGYLRVGHLNLALETIHLLLLLVLGFVSFVVESFLNMGLVLLLDFLEGVCIVELHLVKDAAQILALLEVSDPLLLAP